MRNWIQYKVGRFYLQARSKLHRAHLEALVFEVRSHGGSFAKIHGPTRGVEFCDFPSLANSQVTYPDRLHCAYERHKTVLSAIVRLGLRGYT